MAQRLELGHLTVAPDQFGEFGSIIEQTLPGSECLGNFQQEFHCQSYIYFVAGSCCTTRNSSFARNGQTDNGGCCICGWLHDTVNMVQIVAVRCDVLHTDRKRIGGTT